MRRHKNKSRTPQAAVDAELQNLEERLMFPAHLPPVEIAVPGRHIIFTSHLLMAEDNKWIKVDSLYSSLSNLHMYSSKNILACFFSRIFSREFTPCIL